MLMLDVHSSPQLSQYSKPGFLLQLLIGFVICVMLESQILDSQNDGRERKKMSLKKIARQKVTKQNSKKGYRLLKQKSVTLIDIQLFSNMFF